MKVEALKSTRKRNARIRAKAFRAQSGFGWRTYLAGDDLKPGQVVYSPDGRVAYGRMIVASYDQWTDSRNAWTN